MNILELIKNCEVEWKPLEEISSLYGGLTGKNKADFENGNAKYISYKNIFDNIEVNFSCLDKVKVNEDEKQHYVQYGDVLFTGSSETADEAGMSSAITQKLNEKVYLNSFSFGLRFNDDIQIIPEFAKYLFRSNFIRAEIIKSASGVTRFNVSKARFKKIKIPIPPLEIQQKIVKILDKFTKLEATLEATLEAELTLRKKQYEFYRNQLLTFGDNSGKGGYDAHPLYKALSAHWNGEVEWKSLGEVAEIKNGKDWKHLNLGNIPVYGSGGIMNYVDKYVYDKPTVLIPRKGTITNLFYLETPFWNVDTIYYTKIDSNLIIPKFFYYFLRTIDLEKLDTGSGRPSLTQAILNEIKIPLPPLAVQQKIVEILDKFDTLTHSISQGLPREIELRRKQYEYYREQLLEFANDRIEKI